MTMIQLRITYKCGHSEIAHFEYPTAGRNWQTWATKELCPACETKKGKE